MSQSFNKQLLEFKLFFQDRSEIEILEIIRMFKEDIRKAGELLFFSEQAEATFKRVRNRAFVIMLHEHLKGKGFASIVRFRKSTDVHSEEHLVLKIRDVYVSLMGEGESNEYKRKHQLGNWLVTQWNSKPDDEDSVNIAILTWMLTDCVKKENVRIDDLFALYVASRRFTTNVVRDAERKSYSKKMYEYLELTEVLKELETKTKQFPEKERLEYKHNLGKLYQGVKASNWLQDRFDEIEALIPHFHHVLTPYENFLKKLGIYMKVVSQGPRHWVELEFTIPEGKFYL